MDMKLVDRGNSRGELLLSGRIDGKNAERVKDAFLKTAERFRNVELNMAELTYISSAGLRAIKILYVQVRKNGGELTITNTTPFVAEVFEMTGFSEMLNIR